MLSQMHSIIFNDPTVIKEGSPPSLESVAPRVQNFPDKRFWFQSDNFRARFFSSRSCVISCLGNCFVLSRVKTHGVGIKWFQASGITVKRKVWIPNDPGVKFLSSSLLDKKTPFVVTREIFIYWLSLGSRRNYLTSCYLGNNRNLLALVLM